MVIKINQKNFSDDFLIPVQAFHTALNFEMTGSPVENRFDFMTKSNLINQNSSIFHFALW